MAAQGGSARMSGETLETTRGRSLRRSDPTGTNEHN
jgi:hypothetical protein